MSKILRYLLDGRNNSLSPRFRLTTWGYWRKLAKRLKRKLYYWSPIYKFCHWYDEFRQRFMTEKEEDYEDLNSDPDNLEL